jgi:penicillin-binding protein 1C
MRDVSGVTGAAPVWLELVNYLHRHVPSARPSAPPGLVRAPVTFEGALEPPRPEWFLPGTETPLVARKALEAAAPAIAYPGNGTIIALDPDIPGSAQRVRLLATGAGTAHRFRIDGEDAGAAAGGAFWTPRPGQHELELLDGAGTVVEAARF